MKKSFGKNTIGSGGKMEFDTKTFNRSTHNLNEIFRSTMSGGTLVPCLVIPALPGDTFDIDIDMSILTLPTTGPLFGSWIADVHIYQAPMRMYNRDLQMNKINLGKDISRVKFPQMEIQSNDIGTGVNFEYTKETPWGGKEINNSQIEPSSILSYLGIKGLGHADELYNKVKRQFNAEPWLIYWDIVKQYYTNKMEDDAYYIANSFAIQDELPSGAGGTPPSIVTFITNNTQSTIQVNSPATTLIDTQFIIIVEFPTYERYSQWEENELVMEWDIPAVGPILARTERFKGKDDFKIQRNDGQLRVYYTLETRDLNSSPAFSADLTIYSDLQYDFIKPNLAKYPIENIDKMRDMIMGKDGATPLILNNVTTDLLPPYSSIFRRVQSADPETFEITATQCKQEGLAIKTYQSDVNNNWLNTEWIDGENGVNAVTAITTDSAGTFTLDQFNIKKKVYDMLNHITASGGTYDDWQEISYGVERMKQISSPVFEGGLRKNIVFQEVINNSASEAGGNEQPLGTLAGRGVLGGQHKGGKVMIKCNEPSYIMAIVSITPRIDYSTGNEWHTNLINMGELHNPYLDAIGYQDLVTDTLAFWDTKIDSDGNKTFKSAGKQPSWINYQTSKNKVYGNFALQNEQMFMVLNRRYEVGYNGIDGYYISDVTTYIDPTKFTHIFADTSPDAMNFWVQIGFDVTARRVMSANQIPNL